EPDWHRDWDAIRRRSGSGPSWVAVAYADWQKAKAPTPRAVLDAALATEDCSAILVDTWDKAAPSPLDLSWADWISHARSGGLKVVLAGGLDADAIQRLSPLAPDLFAVRGSACAAGLRQGTIDSALVERLVRAAGGEGRVDSRK
ncbi:(5-formylfuran-3-yl)methyl phosphate synthase, partial [Singulisphaera rosea]